VAGFGEPVMMLLHLRRSEVWPLPRNLLACRQMSPPQYSSASRTCAAAGLLVCGPLVSETPEPDDADQPADEDLWRRPDSPSIDGQCYRCAWRGKRLPRSLRWLFLRCVLRLQWGLDAARLAGFQLLTPAIAMSRSMNLKSDSQRSAC
jgi:hypothetical protein